MKVESDNSEDLIIEKNFKVIPVEKYEYQDAHHHLKVMIPQLESEIAGITEGVTQVNRELLSEMILLLKKYEEEAKQIKEGYLGLDVMYEVITNTKDWFTLRLNILETQASGYEHAKYYHIDKRTGEQVNLSDLFVLDSNYQTVISDNIKVQMKEQMQKDKNIIYNLNNEEYPQFNFEKIKQNQNFYWKETGELVIAFDEYEVAPGYMGSPQFVIPRELMQGILKERYKPIFL